MNGETHQSAGAELIGTRDLNRILQESIGNFTHAFGAMVDVQEALPDSLHIQLTQDNTYERSFPASIPGQRAENLEFNLLQFRLLSRQAQFSEGLQFQDIARLYIGGSLPYKILESAVYPQEREKTNRLILALTDVDQLADAVRNSDFVDENQDEELLHILRSDDIAAMDMNAMRFAVGALFEAEKLKGNSDYVDKMQTAFRSNLAMLFRGKSDYLRLFQGISGSKQRASQQFGSHIRNVCLAVSFPMEELELRTVFEICQSNYDEPAFDFKAVIEPSELGPDDGFSVR